jgi:hypothetical protein
MHVFLKIVLLLRGDGDLLYQYTLRGVMSYVICHMSYVIWHRIIGVVSVYNQYKCV